MDDDAESLEQIKSAEKSLETAARTASSTRPGDHTSTGPHY